MSTINNVLNSSSLNVQNNNQATNTQTQTHVHHHHHHKQDNASQDSVKDSVQISNESSEISSSPWKNPLDSLVANGTITQDQEISIKSAFMSARQSNQAGTYVKSQSSPLAGLVANGTINQSQADSITSAFKSRIQGNENNTDPLLSSILNGPESQDDILDALNTQL